MKNENIIRIKEEFDLDLKEIWEKFEKNSNASFFQTFKWQKYWFEKCGNNQKNIIALFYKKDELISIFPLNIKRQNFVNILNWNGFPFSDYNQPLIKKNQILSHQDFKFIVSQISSKYKFHNIHLINCINCDYLNDKKIVSNKLSKLIFFKDNTDISIIDNLEKKIKYEQNRLKKKFNFEIYIDTHLEKNKILDFFINEKHKQLKRTGAWNYLDLKAFKKYIHDLAEFDPVNLCFSCLKIDNKIISSHIGYKFNNNYYYIFPVYDLNYKKYSPGNILLFKLIQNYRFNKFYAFDFTIGDEIYKKKLNNFVANSYEHIDYNRFLGIFYYFKIKLKILLKLLLYKYRIKN